MDADTIARIVTVPTQAWFSGTETFRAQVSALADQAFTLINTERTKDIGAADSGT